MTAFVPSDPNYYNKLLKIESGGNSNAVNPQSGAAGLFQFMPSTAQAYGLTDPTDANAALAAVQRLTADNANVLTKTLGREPTGGELYLAHQQGGGGASKLLTNPNAKAVDLLGRAAVLNNGGSADMTAGDFANLWLNRYNGVQGVRGGGQTLNNLAPDAVFRNSANLNRLSAADLTDDGVMRGTFNGMMPPDLLNLVSFSGGNDGMTPPDNRMNPPGVQVAQADTGTANDAGGGILGQFFADKTAVAGGGKDGGKNAPQPLQQSTNAPAGTLGQFQTDKQSTQQSLTAPRAGSLTAATTSGSPDLANPIDDPGRLAPVLAQAGGSLPTDPAAKALYIAKSLFPGSSDAEALSHVGYKNGRLIYQAGDGKVYYAEPSFDFSHPGRTFQEGRELIASQAGPSMTAIPAIGGGLLTSEFLGGVPGSAAGGAAGDIARQFLAHQLTGETKLPLDRALQTLEEAGLAGAGQLGGNALFRGVNVLANTRPFGRNALQVSGYDIPKLGGEVLDRGEAATAKAQGMGVTLTPGQATGLPSLLRSERQLQKEPEGADPLKLFYGRQANEQLPTAFDRHVLDKISPVGAPGLGARDMQTAAQDTIDAAVAARKAESKPIYEAVVRPDNVLPPADFNNLMTNNPLAAHYLQIVRADPVLSSSVKGMPDSSLPVLDLVKREMDKAEKGFLADAAGGNKARITGGARDDFVTALDNAFPGYDAARAAYAGASPEVDALREGLVGMAAKDRPGYPKAPETLLGVGNADPMSITSNRNAFIKAGKLDEWNAGVRSYLNNLFETNGSWQAIKPKQLRNLQAAMDPQHFQALNDFMEVAENVKRTLPEGSSTSADIGQRSSFASPLARAAGGVIDVPGMLKWAKAALVEASAGKNIGKLVDTITQPDAIKLLRQIKSLPPGSRQWIAAVTNLGVQVGSQKFQMVPDQSIGTLGSMLNEPPPINP